MRILAGLDQPFLPSSGSLILCDELYSRLAQNGVEVRFVALEGDRSWSSLRDLALHRPRHPKALGGAALTAYAQELADFVAREIASFRPDIVHLHHLTFGMAAAMRLAVPRELPRLAVAHGPDVLFASQYDAHRVDVATTVQWADTVVYPTSALRDTLDLPSQRPEVIPWGVPEELLGRAPRRPALRGRLLFAGRLEANKGIDTLIDALARTTAPWTLTVHGSGDDLAQRIEQRGLRARIEVAPPLPRAALWSAFETFDAVVIPTRHVEGFSLLAVEAQAHGVPVVASRTSGLAEVVGQSAVLFEAGNAIDLASKLDALFDDTKLQEWSRASRANAARYPIGATVERLAALSSRLIAERSTAPHGAAVNSAARSTALTTRRVMK